MPTAALRATPRASTPGPGPQAPCPPQPRPPRPSCGAAADARGAEAGSPPEPPPPTGGPAAATTAAAAPPAAAGAAPPHAPPSPRQAPLPTRLLPSQFRQKGTMAGAGAGALARALGGRLLRGAGPGAVGLGGGGPAPAGFGARWLAAGAGERARRILAEKAPPRPAPPRDIPWVHAVVAVSSGKGGVGKSTVAANLACALAAGGKRVGLLDADIYGPSVHELMGLQGGEPPPLAPPNEAGERLLVPVAGPRGVQCLSVGLLVDRKAPAAWRGPMVQRTLGQFLFGTRWGTAEAPLDVLVMDLPPGTGDAHLTLAQRARIHGALVVSTPQDLALADVRRGMEFFRLLEVPVLGMVENMSYFSCSGCGKREDVFGHGGAAREAASLGIPLLGELPLDRSFGTLAEPETPADTIFRDLAARLLLSLEGFPLPDAQT